MELSLLRNNTEIYTFSAILLFDPQMQGCESQGYFQEDIKSLSTSYKRKATQFLVFLYH